MIFGFNTDVKHGDTIYHVQSEARESEKLLQTQVFVRGRCIGKKAISYATSAAETGFGDPQKEQLLRDQHRLVLESIKDGKLETILDKAEGETLAAIKQLDVQWENASSVHLNRSLTMQLRVTEGGTAVPRARLTFRFARPDAAPFYTQAVTDAGGNAEISVEVDESALPDASVMVQANHEGRTVTRKFALRKA
ncbi:MAG: hypothetical protein JWQ87_365 [Candidatus Sulfotelmatobacter sp.]|nr:hypothetical protein [Candidatus Sulfotelmatobacter sp.]